MKYGSRINRQKNNGAWVPIYRGKRCPTTRTSYCTHFEDTDGVPLANEISPKMHAPNFSKTLADETFEHFPRTGISGTTAP